MRLYLILLLFISINVSLSQINTWTGSTDNDWHKACNWSLNTVPTCLHDVIIPDLATDPNITGIAHCKTIEVQGSTSVLDIVGTGKLEISSSNSCLGTTTNNGGCGPSCGSQVWASANLNIGTMITASGAGPLQTNNGVVEKFCYNNVAANCATYGGLYEWNEAMNYTSSINCDPCGAGGRQGICPTGYHIPTDLEWSRYEHCVETTIAPIGSTTLNTFQTSTGVRGSGVSAQAPGTKLKATSTDPVPWNGSNSSGFMALPAGYRVAGGSPSFFTPGSLNDLWSATQSTASFAYLRYISSSFGGISRIASDKNFGFSVRCLKN